MDSYCCGIQLGFIVRVNTHFAQNDYIRELSWVRSSRVTLSFAKEEN